MLRALGQRCNLIGLQKFCGRYNLAIRGLTGLLPAGEESATPE